MPSGGKREGAGRPLGTGRFGVPTKAMRVPESMAGKILQYVQSQGYALPIYSHSVSAGFPSPADDHIEGWLDLNEHLIKHPAATFFVHASGDSMQGAGIHDGDILVVDRSIEARSGKVVVAAIDGQLTVKRLIIKLGKTWLMPENVQYSPIEIHQDDDAIVWGVVTSVIHLL